MAVRDQTPHRFSKEPEFASVFRADLPQACWGSWPWTRGGFLLWPKSRAKQKYGQNGSLRSIRCSEHSLSDQLAGLRNLLGKPRLLIRLCSELYASDDQRRKGRLERRADLREDDRGVGQR